MMVLRKNDGCHFKVAYGRGVNCCWFISISFPAAGIPALLQCEFSLGVALCPWNEVAENDFVIDERKE